MSAGTIDDSEAGVVCEEGGAAGDVDVPGGCDDAAEIPPQCP